MASYRVIQSFNHTSQMNYGYRIISNLNAYLYGSRLDGDDSVDDTLKFFFNYHPVLVKDFLNHQPMRSQDVRSSY